MSSLEHTVAVAPAPVQAASSGAGALGAVLTFLGLAAWTTALLALCIMGPRFEEIFRDFGMQLSGLTRTSIGLSRWLTGRGAGQMFPGIIVAGPVLLGTTFGIYCARRSWGLALLFLLGGIAMVGAFFAASYSPLVTMIESLQNGR